LYDLYIHGSLADATPILQGMGFSPDVIARIDAEHRVVSRTVFADGSESVTFSDPEFDEALRRIYAEEGRKLGQNTDIAERIATSLGLPLS